MLERGGASVRLAGFCRDEAVSAAPAARQPMVLGRSHDAAMIHRLASAVRWTAFKTELQRFMADCDLLLARNLEQLAISRRLVGKRPLVYECLDIHRTLVGSGAFAGLVQMAEEMLLPRVDLLLTSSSAFVRHHFAKTSFDGPIRLIENKLLAIDGALPEPNPAPARLPIRIGWFGMLRCRKTFAFLAELARASEGRVEVLIAGKASPAELPNLAGEASEIPGMTFIGPYSYADLRDLYGRCHFAWTIDWFEEGLNSSWLLPNRLYEGLAYGAVPIALEGVEVGRWLQEHHAGLVVPDAETARSRLLTLETAELCEMQVRVAEIDRSELIADQEDCRDLVRTLASATLR